MGGRLSRICSSASRLARLRLHRLQALEPRAPHPQADGGVAVEDYGDYVDYLEVHPDEFAELFNTILINVTGFFRDPAAWEYLASEVAPGAARAARRDEPIRVWSAGCASGEEAYTVGDAARRGAGRGGVPRPGEDLRDRRRRGGARRRARQAHLPAEGRSQAVPEELARAAASSRSDQQLHLPQGPAPLGDLRAQRSGPGRADLAHRPAAVPQRPDVLHRRGAGADPRAASTSPCATAASCSSASRRCCYATATLSRPVDLKRRVFRQGPAARPARAARRSATRRRRRRAGRGRHAELRDGGLRIGPGRAARRRLGGAAGRWPTTAPRELFGLGARRHRPAAAGPRDLLPAGRAARRHRPGLRRRAGRSSLGRRRVAPASGEQRHPRRRRSRRSLGRRRRAARRRRSPSPTSPRSRELRRRARAAPSGSWRRPTRSCSRRSRSWRRPTRSCSRPTRSWRRPTRSCSRPTRSSRR